MKIDQYGLLISETCEGPGALGDSCAETSRWVILKWVLNRPTMTDAVRLQKFVTAKGIIRHPDSIWPETDTPTDQAMPLYLAALKYNPSLAKQIKKQIVTSRWCTGNGDLVSPIFYAVLQDSAWRVKAALAIQALLFKIPFRWSDSKKWFEWSHGSTCDYLNYISVTQFYEPWFRIDNKTLLDKISSYYASEPNNEIVMDLYREVLHAAKENKV